MNLPTRVIGAGLIATLLLAGCGTAADPTPAADATAAGGTLDAVTLAVDWIPNTTYTGFYVAQQKGWYKEQNIDLTILPYSEGGLTTDQAVATGKADFGIGFELPVMLDRVNNLPVKSVAAIIQTDTSAMATLKDSGIDSPAQFSGKRFAAFGLPYEEPLIAAMIQCAGGTDTQIQSFVTQVGGYQALVAKQADFLWIATGWEGIQAARDKVELNEFVLSDYCVPERYGAVLITSDTLLKERPDLGKRFVAATAQGYNFAASNPGEAADLMIAANPPGTFPDPGLVRDSAQYMAPFYVDDAPRWGEQTLERWTEYPKFVAQTGTLQDATGQIVNPEFDYGTLFTNELLPAE
jgi:ABC-type nitrate/sulfonate/bicarbonate transport system substrate-binding protein